MGFRLKVVNSCTIVTAQGSSYTGAVNANMVFKNLDTGATYSQTITWPQANISAANLPSPYGVYEVTVYEFGVEVVRRPLLLSCDIDCCLTKLTNELLDCECDCARCSVALAKAQKVFLLLKSAMSTLELAQTPTGSVNSGFYQDILEKYKKAREICDNSCGCNC
tara:strand:+ start:1528 stop:2022 length:495 start_codon:yes stop_codon:yes gene_type:complete